MDCPNNFAASITRDLVCGAVDELRYPCCFDNLVEDLQTEQNKVVETRNNVKKRIDDGKKQTKETAGFVHKWLEGAKNDIDNVEELLKRARTKKKSCCFGKCPNWIWRYSVGKQLAKGKRTITERNKEGSNYTQIERLASLSGLEYFPSEKCLMFKSRQSAYDQLMKALEDDKVNMIGLYGMGGCGKTTLAIEVGKRAKEEELFDEVLFVSVSSTVVIQRIQETIACLLNCELNEKEEMLRAERLHKRLIQEEKVLVILDNVWQILDLVTIGITSSEGHMGCQVLITTRSEDVCIGMDCQKTIRLPDFLTNDEAWDLFQKQAHISEDTSIKHFDLARQISDECGGLPVAITNLASTLKGKAEVQWKVALERLTSSNSKLVDIEKGLKNPYKCLELSYDNLDNREAKSLLLLCSVFPEEYEIPVEVLTRFAIGLGLIEEVHSFERARNEVCTAKTKLTSSCLLLDVGEGNFVKMHGLFRQVALRIAKDEGKGIKCVYEKDVPGEYTLLRYLWGEKFPYQLDCSNLEFLCLHTDLDVLDEIFKGMEKLRVLFLVNKGLEIRPLLTNSFRSLTNLRCLVLKHWKFRDISFLGDLKKLESLTLHKCSFFELPDVVVTQLSNLKLLDLSECDVERYPFEVIGRHPLLQELYIYDFRLEWDSYDERTAGFFNQFSVPQALQRYRIQLGTLFQDEEMSLNHHNTLSLSCSDTSNAAFKDLAKKAEILRMANIQGGAKNIIPDIFQIEGRGMNELIELQMSNSDDIEYLVDTDNHLSQVATIFSKLRKLKIKLMGRLKSLSHGQPPCGLIEKLEELFIEDCELHGTLFVWKLNLCSLKVLELYECPKLTSLFTPVVARSLVHMEKLQILYCPKLKHILADDNKQEISTDHHKLVFPKLKQLTVRGCDNVEYIVPVGYARGLLQLECLEIQVDQELKYVFGLDNHYSQNDLKIEFPLLEKLVLSNLPNIISMCPKNCYPACPSLRQFTVLNCPEVAIVSINAHMFGLKKTPCDHRTTKIGKSCSLKEVGAIKNRELRGMFELGGLSIDEEQDPLKICLEKLSYACNGLVQSMNLQNLEQMEVSESEDFSERQHFMSLHLKSNQLEDFSEITSLPSASLVNYSSGPFTSCNLKRLILRSCLTLRTLFSPSTAKWLTSLEELMIVGCHELRYLVNFVSAHENKEGIIQENPQSYVSVLSRLERISVKNCRSLEYVFHVSYLEGPVKLKEIEIQQTPSLRYVFGHSIHDNDDAHSCHQHQDKIQIELSVLERLELFSIPNMINICPDNYYLTCSSLARIVIEKVGLSTLSIHNLMVHLDHSSTSEIEATGMTNGQLLGSVTVWDNSKIKGIFHIDELPINGQQATSWLIEMNLVNLPELNYVWKGTKHYVTLQNLKLLHIWGCEKLKTIFSSFVSRCLPQLKILVVLECGGLEQIIEDDDDDEHENVSSHQSQKICFLKLKLLLVSHCDNLKRLFYLSMSHEFPELEYLMINHDHHLEQVFEGVRERRVDVLLPKLKHVMLTQLPNLFNVSQWIEFQTVTNIFVHNCPKLSLTSTTTVEDMLRSYDDDGEIDFLFRCGLLYIRDIMNKDNAEKDSILQTTSQLEMNLEDQSASRSKYNHRESGANELREVLKRRIQDSHSLAHRLSSHNLTEGIKGMIEESVREDSISEDATKTALSASTEGNGFGVVVVTHTKHSGGDTLAQHSQLIEQGNKLNDAETGKILHQKIQNVDDSIQQGSILMDKEGEIGGVSNDSTEVTPASAYTCGSHSLIIAEMGAYEHFVGMDDARIALLQEAIAVYPHLWKVCEKFSESFQAWILKTLADMLSFLRNESPVSVTLERVKEFHILCDVAVLLGFERTWIDRMRQRVTIKDPKLDHAQEQLNELLKRRDQLTEELLEINDEINCLDDFVAAQNKCFDFL